MTDKWLTINEAKQAMMENAKVVCVQESNGRLIARKANGSRVFILTIVDGMIREWRGVEE